MNIQIFLLLLCSFLSTSTIGSQHLTSQPLLYMPHLSHQSGLYIVGPDSYSDQQHDALNMAYAHRYALRRFPAVVSSMVSGRYGEYESHGIVSASYSNEIAGSMRQSYESSHTNQGQVLAGGMLQVDGVGTLYGHASYSQEKERDLYANYVTRAADYYPYLVGDTVSLGQRHSERYVLSGGLSLGNGPVRWGVGAYYEGLSTAKITQPRTSVFNYWFRPLLSVALIGKHHLWALNVYPEVSHQSLRATSALSTYRFHEFYGFGMWNRKESQSGLQYAREGRIQGVGGELLYHFRPVELHRWEWLVTLAYNDRRMETEETSFKNLFASHTSHLGHTLFGQKSVTPSTILTLGVQGSYNHRKGKENVYQSVEQHAGQHLFDYVKVGTTSLYTSTDLHEQVEGRLAYVSSPSLCIGVHLGAQYIYHGEDYHAPQLRYRLHQFIPRVGIRCAGIRGAHQWDMTGAVLRGYLSHEGSQMISGVFTPTYPRSFWGFKAEAYYAYTLDSGRKMGVALCGNMSLRHDTFVSARLFYLF